MNEDIALVQAADAGLPLEDRITAIDALCRPEASPRVVSAFSRLLRNPKERIEVARAALYSLLAIGRWSEAMYAGRPDLRRETLAAVARSMRLSAALEAQLMSGLETMRTPGHGLRRFTVVNAGATYGPDPRLIGVLHEVAGDPDPEMRAQALHSLAVVGRLEPVIVGLSDPDESVRWEAAAALGSFGFADEREITSLTAAMESDDAQRVRREARASLHKMGALGRTLAKPGRTAPTEDDLGLVSILKAVSAARIGDPSVAAYLDDDVITSGWIGRPGASVSSIASAEGRIGMRLPPSYRQFLRITNGFDGLPASLFPVEEIGPLAEKEPDMITDWSFDEAPQSDPRYEVYGPEQDPVWFNGEHLPALIMIGPYQEFGCYLLNPRVVFANGEWEAWNLNHAFPGAMRYRTFRDLVEAEARNLSA